MPDPLPDALPDHPDHPDHPTDPAPAPGIADAVTALAREHSGRVLALLARRYRDLDLADEAVQRALVQALDSWPEAGIPDNPPAWLFTVASHKAIDILRSQATEQRHLLAAAPDLLQARRLAEFTDPLAENADNASERMIVDDGFSGDEQLRLMLLCAHPSLDVDTRVALTLRLVGGLSTAEIAQAFLLAEPTLAQRIVRAKHKIRAAGIPLQIPRDLDDRVSTLLSVLYLIFNEGYLSRGPSVDSVRVDLVDEAIRLTSLAGELLPGSAELDGLLALQLFARARLHSRTDSRGELVLLADQDRRGWDRAEIDRANAVLARAMARREPGPFQLEALIAAHHANPMRAKETDWNAIVGLYDQLTQMNHSPVIALNRVAAIAVRDGPAAGLALLNGLTGREAVETYYLFHALRAELLQRTGDARGADAGYRRAIALAVNTAEKRHLERRLAALSADETAPR